VAAENLGENGEDVGAAADNIADSATCKNDQKSNKSNSSAEDLASDIAKLALADDE
jgi:hypothetical protein